MSVTRLAPNSTSRATSASRSAAARSTCMRFLAVFGSGTLLNNQVGSPPRRHPWTSRCSVMPMAAQSLDGLGSSGRPRAADQNRPTVSASSQSTVTAASLTVTPCPPLAGDASVPSVDAAERAVHRLGGSSRRTPLPDGCPVHEVHGVPWCGYEPVQRHQEVQERSRIAGVWVGDAILQVELGSRCPRGAAEWWP